MPESSNELAAVRDRIIGCQRLVYSKCLMMVRHENNAAHLAEDLSQEVILKALKHADKYDGRATVRTWLYRIAHNHAIDYIRRNKRKALGKTTDFIEDLNPDEDASEAARLSLNHTEDRYLSSLYTRRLLNNLKPDERRLILLRGHGVPYEDIARMLDIPLGTLKSRLNRIRMALQETRDSL